MGDALSSVLALDSRRERSEPSVADRRSLAKHRSKTTTTP
jgi:hypothetical protein